MTQKLILGVFLMASVSSFAATPSSELETTFVKEVGTTTQDRTPFYLNNFKMREHRKVGVALGLGGSLGIYGVQLELNLDDENAVLVGLGKGPSYNSFHVQWKHSFEGQYFTPYFSTGYSRWYNSEIKNIDNSSYVLQTVLDQETRERGPFGVDFIVGSAGLQFNQLDGEWIGAGFYFEFTALGSLQKTTLIPSGSVGALYYF